MSDKYEFNDDENDVIRKLLRTMHSSSRLMAGFGSVFLLSGGWKAMHHSWLDGGDSLIIAAILYGVYFFTRSISVKLQAIIDTEGSDIQHLLSVISDVTKLYARASMLLFGLLFLLIASVYLIKM